MLVVGKKTTPCFASARRLTSSPASSHLPSRVSPHNRRAHGPQTRLMLLSELALRRAQKKPWGLPICSFGIVPLSWLFPSYSPTP
jgi:hypothetical protein